MRHKKFSSIGKDLTEEVFNQKTYVTKRKIKNIVVHCSATNYLKSFDAYDIDKWHLKRWGPNSGCGYHYVILLDGTIQKGRWVDYIGSHVKGHNVGTIGICYIGGLDTDNKTPIYDNITESQEKSLKKLLDLLTCKYNLTYDDVLGHNEYPGVHKHCPCLNMDNLREELKERK